MIHTTLTHGQYCLVEKYLTSRKTQQDLLFLFVGLHMARTVHLKPAALVGGNDCHDVAN
jgi:hypothetical protein